MPRSDTTVCQRLVLLAAVSQCAVTMIGCGGGGGGLGGQTLPPPEPEVFATGTLSFDVDSGQVSVLSGQGNKQALAVFDGSAIKLSSSSLAEVQGETSIKRFDLLIQNNLQDYIGVDGRIRATIEAITPSATGGANLRASTNVSTLAGVVGSTGTGSGPANSAITYQPRCIATYSGNTYWVDAQGKLKRLRDEYVSELADLTPGAETISDIVVLGGGSELLATRSDHVVLTVDLSTDPVAVAVLAGEPNTPGGADGYGSAARFDTPTAIISNEYYDQYVADKNGLRRIYSGAYVTTDSSPGQFPLNVSSMALAGGDRMLLTVGHTITVFNRTTGTKTAIGSSAGYADGFGDTAKFDTPISIVRLNQSQDVYAVAEYTGHRIRYIQRFDEVSAESPKGWWVSTYAGDGTSGAVNGEGTNAKFFGPRDLALMNDSSLAVADFSNVVIRRLTYGGVLPFDLGSNYSGSEKIEPVAPTGYVRASTEHPLPFYENANALPGGSGISIPIQLIIPENVRQFTMRITIEGATSYHASLEANQSAGSTPQGSSNVFVRTICGGGANFGFADGMGSNAQFGRRLGVAIDASGTIYVADRDNASIRMVSLAGKVSTLIGQKGLTGSTPTDGTGLSASVGQCADIAVTPDGKTIVVTIPDRHIIRKAVCTGSKENPADWLISTWYGADNVSGSSDGSGASARFNGPLGIAHNKDTGEWYVADTGNHRVRRLSAVITETLAGSTQGYVNGLKTAAQFNRPTDVAVLGDGRVVIADADNHVIRISDPNGNVSTYAGPVAATAGFADAQGTSARFTGPTSIAVDPARYAYVLNNGANLRRVSPAASVRTVGGGVNAGRRDGIAAQALFTSGGTESVGMALNPHGDVVVGDSSAIRLVSRLIRGN